MTDTADRETIGPPVPARGGPSDMSQPTEHHLHTTTTTTDPRPRSTGPTGTAPLIGDTEQPPSRYSGKEKAGIIVSAALVIAAIIILIAAIVRTNNQPTGSGTAPISTPSATATTPAPSTSTPSIAAQRAADQAAAVAANKKLDALYDKANKQGSMAGLGLEKLVSPAQLAAEKKFMSSLHGERFVGTAVITYKARSWVGSPNGNTSVEVASCHDNSKTKILDKNGENTEVGPDGKPVHFVMGVSKLVETASGQWMLTSDRVVPKGSGKTCSLDAPY